MNKPKYTLDIDLNVLNHLGLNLYSNIPAVLSELIANTWDADATDVKIVVDKEKIIIEDNGCGMDIEDLNNKFLTVGYERRGGGQGDLTTKHKRLVMGRKGIGKLSVFSIADDVEVISKKENHVIGISLNVPRIKAAIEAGDDYHPDELRSDQIKQIESDAGTIIILKKLKKRIYSSLDSNLKKRISRRFDIWDDNFRVTVNGHKVEITDRDYFHKLEFATVYGGYPQDRFSSADKKRIHQRSSEKGVYGWIGLAKESSDLEEGNENLNKISILTRGKVAMENVLDLHRIGGLYTKFLIGEIRADFLDDTSKDDIATSNRQDFIQNDERFEELKLFMQEELKFIVNQRNKYKDKEGIKKASEIPAIKEWFSTLKGDTKKSAKKFFGRINKIATDQEHRMTLCKHGVLAFEHLRHREQLRKLDKIDIGDMDVAVKLFLELDDIEASWYYQITEGRLEVIKQLSKHVESNALEKVIQEHIYKHLWLLDPSWDRATELPAMEKSIKLRLEKMSNKQQHGRIDIRYKKVSGEHIIIELKRSSVVPTCGQLMDQVAKYRAAVEEELRHHGESGDVEIICLVGNGLAGWDGGITQKREERSLHEQNVRVVTYKKLIKDAENGYKEYLQKRKEKGRISELLNAIDDSVADDS